MNEEEIQDQNQLDELNQFEGLIQGLIDNEYGCCDDFILPSTVDGLSANIQLLSESEKLKSSGFGNKSDFKEDDRIRGDKITWIEEQSINPFEIIYLQKIEKFILYLNQTCFTAIKSFESHYSFYEKNSFYKRHIDQFKNEKGRKYSIVLYLNEAWKKEDGGTLSLYPKVGEQINISPIGGRMVLFRSDEMEHEVNPSFTRSRNSIAGWLKN
ncbi:2OG-Fe(II) oxygenase [Fluviicola taffensis]|jgi:SM-20-related protein|uniref:2OG-Fe(II) oxygenase n=1 Tax=Fluviicola taffensis (strain DSM 16823 / NCIMB 13979 / RW262) TaxID=755732 RepID=F2IA43_FLUTR|nr:2OG-Fe(II) oxygenase [Fluviicola taffensis]AEA45220.1 2OG-Fe(II) oxygenase [Fluviicola taffensis DSM 16823]